MTVPNRAGTAQPLAYTREQVQPLLNLGRDKVYSLLRSGELRSRRVGRKWLVPADALAEFLKGPK